MVKTSPLWLLVKVIAIMYAATLAKLWLRQKWRARMWCPRSQKKKSFRYQRPTTRITDFCYQFWELKKVGRVSSLEKNVVEIFFLDLQVTLVNISMRWKYWEINSANSRINTWFVTFFFFGFIICILFQINWINYFARKCIALHDLEIAHLYWYH